jgi:hypothetical protein
MRARCRPDREDDAPAYSPVARSHDRNPIPPKAMILMPSAEASMAKRNPAGAPCLNRVKLSKCLPGYP